MATVWVKFCSDSTKLQCSCSFRVIHDREFGLVRVGFDSRLQYGHDTDTDTEFYCTVAAE